MKNFFKLSIILVLLMVISNVYGQPISQSGKILPTSIYVKTSDTTFNLDFTQIVTQINKNTEDIVTLQQDNQIQATIQVTLPAILSIKSHTRSILISNSGTFTIPLLPDGFVCKITNGSLGTVTLKLDAAYTKLNGAVITNLTKNYRGVELIVYSNNKIDIR